jgi:hypothetical protein
VQGPSGAFGGVRNPRTGSLLLHKALAAASGAAGGAFGFPISTIIMSRSIVERWFRFLRQPGRWIGGFADTEDESP